jgi:hypothetical protein
MGIFDMNISKKHVSACVVWLGLIAGGNAQTSSDQIAVPFSDPSRPGTVEVNVVSGSVSVKGYGGKEVLLVAGIGDEETARRERRSRPESAGLKRIPNFSGRLSVEEEGNVIRISLSPIRGGDVALQAPSRTSLRLKAVNGDIKVEQVQGEIEVNAVNGSVTLTQVSGAVVAHSLHKDVKVVMAAVAPDKPMSFSSLHGDIDVALPADIKANVSIKAYHGEIYSDFDIKLDKTLPPPPQENSRDGRRSRIEIDRSTRGTINGGGPAIQFNTFHGNIYIRKAAK